MHRNVWVKLFSLGSFGLLTGSLQFHRVYTLSLEYFSSELGAMLLSLVIVLVLSLLLTSLIGKEAARGVLRRAT